MNANIQPAATHIPQEYAEGLRGPWERDPDYQAPDGSRFWVITQTGQAGIGHCELPPGAVSISARHQTVEEIWQFTHGRGQVRRVENGEETVVNVSKGFVLIVRPNVEFQFRTIGTEPLQFFVITTPPWPGAHEAVLLRNQGWNGG